MDHSARLDQGWNCQYFTPRETNITALQRSLPTIITHFQHSFSAPILNQHHRSMVCLHSQVINRHGLMRLRGYGMTRMSFFCIFVGTSAGGHVVKPARIIVAPEKTFLAPRHSVASIDNQAVNYQYSIPYLIHPFIT